MASFKVGQRVRIVGSPLGSPVEGLEATVIGPLRSGLIAHGGGHFTGYPLDVDGYGRLNDHGMQMYARAEHLAPLTDPNAKWASSAVKKLVERCKPTELAL